MMTDPLTASSSSEAAVITTESAKADVTAGAETGKNQQVADATTAGKSDGDKAAEATKDVAEGAPEKYEFTQPEGRNYDNEVMNTYSEVAKELNLSQKSAQTLLDRIGAKAREREAENLRNIHGSWRDSSRSDKEYGGDSIDRNLAIAKKALDTFGTQELRTLLNDTGLGNHPEVIRLFYRAGKTISDDTFVGNTGGTPSKGQPRNFADQASLLYSNNNQ